MSPMALGPGSARHDPRRNAFDQRRNAGDPQARHDRTARIFVECVREFTGGDSEATSLVELLLAILVTMLHELSRLTKRAFDVVREEEACHLLMSIPSVGPA